MEEWRSLDAAHPRPKPSRRTAAFLITPIIVLIAMTNAGDVLTTSWAGTHPLALLALNARNRVVLLVTNQLDPFSYYTVGTIRLLVSDPLFFLLGMFYGDTAVQWVERKSKTFGEQLRLYEKVFSKAAYPLVFIAPNNIICLLAGAAGMPIAAFIVLNVTGTVLRLYLLRVVGDVFSGPIDSVLQFFADYRLQLFVASVVIFGAILLIDRRRGRSQIGDLLDLEEELEHGETGTAS